MEGTMIVIKLYFVGIAFLIAALVINSVAKFLGFPSWYDFLAQPQLTLKSGFWLFVGYPFFLGLVTFLLQRFF